MQSKGIFSAFAALLIVGAVVFLMKMQAPDLSRFDSFRDPAIRLKQSQRVRVVEAKGSPEKVGKKAFNFLLRTYYGLRGVPLGGPRMACPRARWPLSDSLPESEWVGRYAMPIPDSISDPKLPNPPQGLTIGIETWDYGDVAEILHIGSYETEKADIARLDSFIHSKGMVAYGDHEEEYVKGPGMFFRGNPKSYFTIIRYRVKNPDTIAAAVPVTPDSAKKTPVAAAHH
jgi:hypothetical protein